jgi:predicted alpha-1,6-mannanase (GH76 family)
VSLHRPLAALALSVTTLAATIGTASAAPPTAPQHTPPSADITATDLTGTDLPTDVTPAKPGKKPVAQDDDPSSTPPDASKVQLTKASKVCVTSCDGIDPASAAGDATPVKDKPLGDATLSLHTSPTDNIGWATLTGGTKGDTVWIERSWDKGSTREQPLEPTIVKTAGKKTATTSTEAINGSDPVDHRRGVVRACAKTSDGSDCTPWAYKLVHGQSAKDDAPAPTSGHVQKPVDPARGKGREVTLNFSSDGRAWASAKGVAQEDQVFVQRSWDGGTSHPGDGALGRIDVPAGTSTATTTAFQTRDTRAKLYGGVARACVKTGGTSRCTDWARATGDRAAAATDALMYDFDPYEAWWHSSWWNSAVATHTLIDYQKQTGDTTYAWAIDRIFEVNRKPFPAGEKSTDEIEGNFVSRAIDDSGWWGLAWIEAYDLTGDTKYRDMAETIGEYMTDYWDEDTCGGGVWWDGERTYKNAVTNGQYIRLTAELFNRTQDHAWLDRSTKAWDWFSTSGMIDKHGLVHDGVDSTTCKGNNQTVHSYNQGLPIGAGVELYTATGDTTYLDKARRMADATFREDEDTNKDAIVDDGVLADTCEALDAEDPCDDNAKQFKGIYARYLGDLNDATHGEYQEQVDAQADAVWNVDRDDPARDDLGRIGVRWTGKSAPGHPNVRDWRTQASGLGAILAAG